MLSRLKLVNFQKHEELVAEFTQGLNVIRGANENGKSTLMLAIAYAFYGARALPLSLEDTVTWGKPASSLRVDLAFDHAGQDYTIVRKKSGAELLGPDGLRVSGHSEVTSYIEKLFNAGMAVAIATMIAGQGQLKESLDGSAVSLIEQLSNMGLIDALVEKIHTQLPSGNTKLFESQLAALADLTEPVADFSALEAAVTAADAAEYAAADAAEVAQAEFETAKAEADAAAVRIKTASDSEIRRRMLENQIDAATRDLEQPVPVCTERLTAEELVERAAQQASQAILNVKWGLYTALPVPSTYVPRDELTAELAAATDNALRTAEDIREAELQRATAKAGIITQSACGLCGKDLSEIPEVVRVNGDASAKVDYLTRLLAEMGEVLKRYRSKIEGLQLLLHQDQLLTTKCEQLTGFVTQDRATVPVTVLWSGGARQSPEDTEDYPARLATVRKHESLVMVHASQVAKARQTHSALQLELAATPLYGIDPLDTFAAATASTKLKDAQAAVILQNAAKQTVSLARFELASATQAHSFELERHAASLAKREELVSTLAVYSANNRLVKKLRDARPVVARKLWGSVLSAVSTYFSSIRGTQSTVTRGESKFLIDGKSIAAYSGSTKDALGLAIRVTLQKTFLGSVDFMLCDEPASAADDNRESAMLGMLSTCGYGQVILVTHSDLADAFATNIIRI